MVKQKQTGRQQFLLPEKTVWGRLEEESLAFPWRGGSCTLAPTCFMRRFTVHRMIHSLQCWDVV